MNGDIFMTGKLLSPDTVAKLLDVSPATVRIWLRNGTLKGLKVGAGKLWRISEEDIQDFLYKNRAQSTDS
jgi:excisionase family DNA binding protein